MHVSLLMPGKGQNSWLSYVVSNCGVCHFPIGILDQVWCLIVSIHDPFPLSYFYEIIFFIVNIIIYIQWTDASLRLNLYLQ